MIYIKNSEYYVIHEYHYIMIMDGFLIKMHTYIVGIITYHIVCWCKILIDKFHLRYRQTTSYATSQLLAYKTKSINISPVKNSISGV